MTRKLLARYPLLESLSHSQLDDWLGAGREIECASGETLFQENTTGAWAYLIRAGRVRIVRQSGTREVTLGTLLPGDLFGEYALLSPGRNTASCRASIPTTLLQLPLDPLRAALRSEKRIWKNLKNWLRLHTLSHFHRERAFLGFLSAESSLKFLNLMQPTAISAGHTIQTDGLAADFWHLIEAGTVRLHPRDDASAAEDLGPGDAFGARALIGTGGLPTAVALTDVRCQVLARHDFDPAAPVWSKVAQSYQPRGSSRPADHVWVPQLGFADCGLAALAMVALRFGLPISVQALRRKVTPGPEGLSLHQLTKLAAEIGLPCQAVRISADRLGQVSLPAIAHLSDGHYVVLHEIGPAGAVVGDPATGIVAWSVRFLSQYYSESLLLFDGPAATSR